MNAQNVWVCHNCDYTQDWHLVIKYKNKTLNKPCVHAFSVSVRITFTGVNLATQSLELELSPPRSPEGG